MASLYEINQELLNCIDLETGEIIEIDKFDELQIEREDKIENIALWYKNLVSDAEAYKTEKDAFAAKEKAAKSKAESLKNYLDSALKGQKFKTVKTDISYRKSKSVEIVDETIIPGQYLKVVTTSSPDKTEIAKALKDGKSIEGVALKENNNIQIK